MAAPELRIVRRRRSALTASAAPTPNALVAASAPVTNPRDVFKTGSLGGRRTTWQNEAWSCLDRVGEFAWYVRWRARGCSRARLVASEIDEKTGLPTGGIRDDDPAGKKFAAIVRQIAGGPLGQAQLIKRTTEVLQVPGELWHTILITPQGQKWVPVSSEEIEPDGNSIRIVLPDGTKHLYNPGNGDGMYKVWDPHPRKASEPNSPARANLDSLREIMRTTKKIKNADLSRLLSAGAFLIPQEASLPSSVAPVSADKPGDNSTPPTPLAPGAKAAESVQQAFVRVAKTAVEEGEDSLAATVPIVIAMPGEHIKDVKRITFVDEVTAIAIQTRNDAIERLAKGLDMTPEQLRGLGSSSNHWNAFMLQDEDVQLHISPVLELICQAIYNNVLAGMLVKADIDPTRYTLWYDTSRLTADPDLTDEVKDAHEKGAASTATLLRVYGLPEDAGYDLTTIEGYQQLAKDKLAAADPATFAQLLHDVMPLLDAQVQAIDFPDPTPALPPAPLDGQDGQDELVDPGSPPDTEANAQKQLTASVDPGVALATDSYLIRALDIAGKKRVRSGDGEQKARLRGVEPHDYYRMMPPVADSEVGKLIAGYDSGLDRMAAKWGFEAADVRAAVLAEARRRLTSPVVDA